MKSLIKIILFITLLSKTGLAQSTNELEDILFLSNYTYSKLPLGFGFSSEYGHETIKLSNATPKKEQFIESAMTMSVLTSSSSYKSITQGGISGSYYSLNYGGSIDYNYSLEENYSNSNLTVAFEFVRTLYRNRVEPTNLLIDTFNVNGNYSRLYRTFGDMIVTNVYYGGRLIIYLTLNDVDQNVIKQFNEKAELHGKFGTGNVQINQNLSSTYKSNIKNGEFSFRSWQSGNFDETKLIGLLDSLKSKPSLDITKIAPRILEYMKSLELKSATPLISGLSFLQPYLKRPLPQVSCMSSLESILERIDKFTAYSKVVNNILNYRDMRYLYFPVGNTRRDTLIQFVNSWTDSIHYLQNQYRRCIDHLYNNDSCCKIYKYSDIPGQDFIPKYPPYVLDFEKLPTGTFTSDRRSKNKSLDLEFIMELKDSSAFPNEELNLYSNFSWLATKQEHSEYKMLVQIALVVNDNDSIILEKTGYPNCYKGRSPCYLKPNEKRTQIRADSNGIVHCKVYANALHTYTPAGKKKYTNKVGLTFLDGYLRLERKYSMR